MKPSGRFLQVNGSKLHVVVDGGGPPVLVCGGLAGNWFDWDAVTRALEPDHTVIRFDRPGFGLSAPTGRPPTVRGEAERICAVLDAVGVVDPVLIVGHSMGGWYAEAFARLHGDRASGLVLLDASVEPPRQPALPSRWRYGLATAAAAVASRSGLQRLCAPTVHRLAHQSEPDAATVPLMERIVTEPSYLRAVLLENAAYTDLPAELASIRGVGPLPDTLVVAADQGLPWSPAWLRTQRRLAADLGARLEILRPARHTAMIDRPAAVAALIAGMTV
ncbi:alpha/beta fold hydrolase [Rhodococcus spelaei]|uniref:alpha/beta fold hydrolase n=1 Tax=Rhodococcus spelaei TaxID=2546320 RepID=UPI001FE2BF13|nr:alpha/beta hydrolase [Rhodococcus spelaei]